MSADPSRDALSTTHTSATPDRADGFSERRQRASRSRVFHDTTATTIGGVTGANVVTPRLAAVRVLTVGNLYPPHHFGGYEQVWRSAVQHLRGQGHDVRVLATGYRHDDIEDGSEP